MSALLVSLVRTLIVSFAMMVAMLVVGVDWAFYVNAVVFSAAFVVAVVTQVRRG